MLLGLPLHYEGFFTYHVRTEWLQKEVWAKKRIAAMENEELFYEAWNITRKELGLPQDYKGYFSYFCDGETTTFRVQNNYLEKRVGRIPDDVHAKYTVGPEGPKIAHITLRNRDSKLHNVCGPAKVIKGGARYFYLNGQELDRTQWKARIPLLYNRYRTDEDLPAIAQTVARILRRDHNFPYELTKLVVVLNNYNNRRAFHVDERGNAVPYELGNDDIPEGSVSENNRGLFKVEGLLIPYTWATIDDLFGSPKIKYLINSEAVPESRWMEKAMRNKVVAPDPVADKVENQEATVLRSDPLYTSKLGSVNGTVVAYEPTFLHSYALGIADLGLQEAEEMTQATQLANAAKQGIKMGALQATGDALLGFAKELAKDIPSLQGLLETVEGRELVKLLLAGAIHSAAYHTEFIPKKDAVKGAMEMQISTSVMTLSSKYMSTIMEHLPKLLKASEQLAEGNKVFARVAEDLEKEEELQEEYEVSLKAL